MAPQLCSQLCSQLRSGLSQIDDRAIDGESLCAVFSELGAAVTPADAVLCAAASSAIVERYGAAAGVENGLGGMDALTFLALLQQGGKAATMQRLLKIGADSIDL